METIETSFNLIYNFSCSVVLHIRAVGNSAAPSSIAFLSLLCSGLIDEGENAEAAALRELKEETGYKGEVVGVTPVTCLDPGLSNCTTQIVMVNINGDEVENINPTQQLGDGEFVEVILLPLDEFQLKIDELLKKEKIVVDAKVYIFAMGMVQAFFKPRELPVLKQ